jgi:hypothetical protein
MVSGMDAAACLRGMYKLHASTIIWTHSRIHVRVVQHVPIFSAGLENF